MAQVCWPSLSSSIDPIPELLNQNDSIKGHGEFNSRFNRNNAFFCCNNGNPDQFYTSSSTRVREQLLSVVITCHDRSYDVGDLYEQIQRCINDKDGATGRHLQCLIVQQGLESSGFLGCHLIRMFTALGSLSEAKQAFLKVAVPSVFVWRAFISSLSKLGDHEGAIQLLDHMLKDSSIVFNEHIVVALLEACATARDLLPGMDIHALSVEYGLDSDLFVNNTLIDMYARCSSLSEACILFEKTCSRDVVTWNALLTGFIDNQQCKEALLLFQQMLIQEDMVWPSSTTFICALKASSGMLEEGEIIHSYVMECGFERDIHLSVTVINMYAECGRLEDAKAMFESLPVRGVVAWNALIGGYVDQGHGTQAFQLFLRMKKESVEPNETTFVSILKACSSMSALENGRLMHMEIVGMGFEPNLFISSALIEMYASCGSLEEAQTVLERLPMRDIVTWSAMISGYAQHGIHGKAKECFTQLQLTGLRPNHVSFLCLLSAYSHLGLVREGRDVFLEMRETYGVIPNIDHMNSMVALFGQAGMLDEAEELLECVPVRANLIGWRTLLGACRKQCNVDIGKRCFELLVSMDKGSAAGYLLMSNIYSHAGLHLEAERVETMRLHANAAKKPGKAYIEIDKVVHSFEVADRKHPQSDIIHDKLRELNRHMRQQGYQPRLDLILDKSLGDKEKEDALCGHCERMAIAFGLLSTPEGTSIRILKNLRMCADCHAAAKIISKIESRQIYITDTYCVHQFSDGECSCTD